MFYYPCPCGDKFQISVDELMNGEEVARCPSCSLIIRVIYDPEDFFEDEEGGEKVATESTAEIVVA